MRLKGPCRCPDCGHDFVGEIDDQDLPPAAERGQCSYNCGKMILGEVTRWRQVCGKCLDERAGWHFKGWAVGKRPWPKGGRKKLRREARRAPNVHRPEGNVS